MEIENLSIKPINKIQYFLFSSACSQMAKEERRLGRKEKKRKGEKRQGKRNRMLSASTEDLICTGLKRTSDVATVSLQFPVKQKSACTRMPYLGSSAQMSLPPPSTWASDFF